MSDADNELRAKLNTETGKISWQELQPHFARGVVVLVEEKMDLIDVAVEFINDNKQQVEEWLSQGVVAMVSNEQAKTWADENPVLWSVVAAPWVLVQKQK